MTNADIALSRPGVAEHFASTRLAQLRDAIEDYRVYRRTVAELNGLNARQLADLGIAAHDIKAVAREAAGRS